MLDKVGFHGQLAYSSDQLNNRDMNSDVNRPLKPQLYEAIAKVAQALASGNRLQLLEFLAQRERSVDELAGMTGLTVGNTSQHLQALRQAALVTSRKEAQRVYYTIAGDDVVQMCRLPARRGGTPPRRGRQAGARLHRPPRRAGTRSSPPKCSTGRSAASCWCSTCARRRSTRRGTCPGRSTFRSSSSENRLAELPKRKEIVAYCRGPYCLMSFDAVDKLRKAGPARPAPSGRVPGMESGRAAGRAVSASCIADEPDRGGEHLVPRLMHRVMPGARNLQYL